MFFKGNYWKILKVIMKSSLMVNSGQTQGKILHPLPLHHCSLEIFNVVTQQHYEEENTIPHFIHSQKEKYSITNIEPATDFSLLSHKSLSLSLARPNNHQSLFLNISAHSTTKKLFSAGFASWIGLTKYQLSTKTYREKGTVPRSGSGALKRRGWGFHFLSAVSCWIR